VVPSPRRTGDADFPRPALLKVGVSWHSPMDVVLRFRTDQVPYGGVPPAFRAGGLFEICRWILGWGDAVEVISPGELRDEVSHNYAVPGWRY
jgi:hypothetical protein